LIVEQTLIKIKLSCELLTFGHNYGIIAMNIYILYFSAPHFACEAGKEEYTYADT